MNTAFRLQQPYDPADFARDPGKYRLFKTARIAAPVPSSPHLYVGQYVLIRFFDVVYNAKTQRNEPVFEVNANDAANPAFLYALALCEFCL